MKKTLIKNAKKADASHNDRAEAAEAIRNYDYHLKLHKLKEQEKREKEEDKAYKRNFFKFAKEITNGSFGQEAVTPTFTKSTADSYYKQKYETHANIDKDMLHWFPRIEEPTISYNLEPYKPRDIRKALGKKDKNSAPGYDDIVYECLLKMPYVHKVLATLFTRIRDEGIAPDVWGASKENLSIKMEVQMSPPTLE